MRHVLYQKNPTDHMHHGLGIYLSAPSDPSGNAEKAALPNCKLRILKNPYNSLPTKHTDTILPGLKGKKG